MLFGIISFNCNFRGLLLLGIISFICNFRYMVLLGMNMFVNIKKNYMVKG